MSTTQLFVEQIFIGFMVLLIAALPYHPEIYGHISQLESWESFGSGAVAIVGIAYLLGILFDRFADTLLDDLIRHQRLRYALKEGLPEPWTDPFPEDRYRIGALSSGASVVEYMDYLRSRIRLARALAVYLPGLTFAGVLAFLRDDGASLAPGVRVGQGPTFGGDQALAYLQLVVPAIYLLAAWLNARNDARGQSPPKTFEHKKVELYAQKRGFWPTVSKDLQRRTLRIDLLRNPTIALLGLLALGAAVVAGASCRPSALWFALASLLLAVMAGWTWWRISETFYQYLKDLDRYGRSRPAGGPVVPS